jgi:hypothetical protein
LAAVVMAATIPAARAQQSFATPEAAAQALVDAVRSQNRRAVLTVLGSGTADIVSSGDDVADADARRRFLEAYDDSHHVARGPDNRTVLYLGHDDFPFPIPLTRNDGTWRFDTAAGRLEILYRRIGRNELAAMQTCLAYVDAQLEYAEKDRTGGGAGAYAQRFVSRPAQKDGLYWPALQEGEVSPLGVFAALASAEGYTLAKLRQPYHGYYYKILTKQGSNARGGAVDYVVRGRMIGGFALVAYPAEYGNSGVMTFLINHEGVLFEKDLGPRSGPLAERMWSFNPDQTWKKVAEAE